MHVFGARENAECNAAPAHDLFSLVQERMRKKKVQERMRERESAGENEQERRSASSLFVLSWCTRK
jgi:hypothetical protein